MSPLFFVHIPKTAGTSFRLGAERLFGKEKVVYDYGKDSDATSPVTRDFLYGETVDAWGFAKVCHQHSVAMMGGHVPIARFASLAGVGNTVTFLRDPLQRIASDYAHFVRHYGYQGTFREFYSLPVMHNRQSSFLESVNLEAVGVAGVTECYAESLRLINARYGIDIPQREDNRGKVHLGDIHDISEEDRAELIRLNRRDIALYHNARHLLDQRLSLFQKDQPYCHACLIEVNSRQVAGWAWWEGEDDSPVEVEVWINNHHVATVVAVEHRPWLCRLQVPRGGYIGFSRPVNVKPGDQVQCRIAKTGQWFPTQPRQVPSPGK